MSTPATARALARDAVARGRATVHLDDVALVVSELVTNAVVHGAGEITLDLTVADDAVRVEVADLAPGLPGALPITPDSESGRGLYLVSKIARDWGVRPAGTGGKVVWAHLAG